MLVKWSQSCCPVHLAALMSLAWKRLDLMEEVALQYLQTHACMQAHMHAHTQTHTDTFVHENVGECSK